MAIEQRELFGLGHLANTDVDGKYIDHNLVVLGGGLSLSLPFTVNLWVNKRSAFAGIHTFISLFSDSGGGDISCYEIGTNNITPFRFRMRVQDASGAATATPNTSVALAINTWYMVTAVFTASNNRTLYVNAANPVTNTVNRIVETPTKYVVGGISSGNAIFLNTGKNPPYGVSLYAGAYTAEVGIWTAALNADEITSLYKGARTVQVRPQSLRSYLPLIREYKQELTGRNSSVGIDPDYDANDFFVFDGNEIVATEPIPVVDHGIRRYG